MRFALIVLLLLRLLIAGRPRSSWADRFHRRPSVPSSLGPSVPRVLNSDDIILNPNDPEPLFEPTGDFNKDGTDDIAISGIYVLEKGPNRYFLLVAAVHADPVRYDKLFYAEFDKPVFLHQPGTTGESSIQGTPSFFHDICGSSCTDGQDLCGIRRRRHLEQKEWEQRRREYRMIIQHRPDRTPDPR